MRWQPRTWRENSTEVGEGGGRGQAKPPVAGRHPLDSHRSTTGSLDKGRKAGPEYFKASNHLDSRPFLNSRLKLNMRVRAGSVWRKPVRE